MLNCKKIIILLNLLFIILMLFSCKYMSKEERNMIKMVSIGDEIIRCINGKDKKSLSNLFCDKIKNTDYLNRQIDFFFDYIDKQGGIIIDDTGEWTSNGGHAGSNGWNIVVDYKGMRYDKDILIGIKKYSLHFGAYITLAKHKEYEGITHIQLFDIRDLSNATPEQATIAWNDKTAGEYMGIGIYNINFKTYLDENVAPKEIYENEEYRFDDDELEKNHSNW